MPRELEAASSLPSREQWGHCGRPGKCGQILGLAVTHWVGRYHHALSSTQVGGEWWLPALPMGPGRKQGQPQEHHASVAGGPAEQPRSYQFVWVQNEVRQPQAQSCQPTPACSRPDCELAAEHCQHCQHRTWVSSRISCALRMRYGRTGAGGTRFFSPQSHISMVGASADLGPRASGEPENSST